MVDAVCRRDRGFGSTRDATVGGPPPGANSLSLSSSEFENVVTELERSCGIPLLREALQCSTPMDLVALVNQQVMSGV